ncbi:hypothetical protein D9O50_05145 [Oxalobacteraceae bacterium CAVE-383]|nr:hypothetical protein D9O50_05145 [Oxalobacteraceae bacterium CAVE-383]
MQIKGRAWSQSLLRPAMPAENVVAPNGNALPPTNRPPCVNATAPAAHGAIDAGHGGHPPADVHLRSLLQSCEKLSRQIAGAGAAEGRQYAGALGAINALSRAIISQQQRIPQSGPARMETEGGIIAVDLDEAIHGLYTAVAYTKNACANGFGALGETMTRDATLWANDPATWLAQSAQSHGAADVTLAGIVTVALVPFALMALHAGISEMRESRAQGKILGLEVARSREFLDTLDKLSASLPAAATPKFQNLVDAAKKTCAQQLEDLQHFKRKNQENGQIGFYSAMSGGSIAAKATLDLGAKVGSLSLAGTAATALATTVGAAGAILSPIAAASAVGLGAKMVIKSNAALKKFAPVAARLTNRLESDTALGPLSRETAGKHDYLEFLPKKLRQRLHFFRDYAQKNKRFLFGSILYATCATVSFGLTAAALVGAGIALGPIGMGILIAGGIAGGMLMGRYSSQFLFGHGRMHRYENYSVSDDPELDRHFLGAIETFTDKNPNIAKTAGIDLRAAFYKQAATRDELRQDFLSEVGGDLGKRYHQALSHSTDSDEVRAKRGGMQSKWDVLCATVQKKYEGAAGYSRACMNYLDNVLHMRGHAAAKASAGALRQKIKPYLSVGNLQDWLHEPANHPKQIALMHNSLKAQIDYLRKKTALRLEMYMHGNNIQALRSPRPDGAAAVTVEASITSTDYTASQHALLEKLAAPFVRDADMLGQTENLQAELAQYQKTSSDRPSRPALAKITSRFLSLQCGLPYDPDGEIPDIRQSQAALAHYYLKEAPGRYRNLRGLLVDAELQATRLAGVDAPEQLNPQSAAGTSRDSR